MKLIQLTKFCGLLLLLIYFGESPVFSQNSKLIKGKVTHATQAISNVHILNLSTKKATKTNVDGKYQISANNGDQLVFSYVGMKSVTRRISNTTTTLNIALQQDAKQLDEVTVKSKRNVDKVPIEVAMNMEFKTSRGKVFRPAASSGPVIYFDNDDMKKLPAAQSLEQVLVGRYSNVYWGKNSIGQDVLKIRQTPVTFDIDGMFYEIAPPIEFSDVVHMFVMKKEARVIVRTKDHPDVRKARIARVTKENQNQNYYNNDVVSDKVTKGFSKPNLITITGKVTEEGAPIPDVHIVIVGKRLATKTRVDGTYKISADKGDVVKFTHIAYNPVSVVVEDVTSILNIKLEKKVNELEDVVVRSNRKKGRALIQSEKLQVTINTGVGKIDLNSIGSSVGYVSGKDLSLGSNVLKSISGRISNTIFKNGHLYVNRGAFLDKALYDVDGQISHTAPNLNAGEIVDVYLLKTAPARYGNKVVLIVKTIGNVDYIKQEKEAIAEEHKNQNYYNNNAITSNSKFGFSNVEMVNNKIELKEITGKLSYLESAVPDVHVSVVGRKDFNSFSNTKGGYKIKAYVGDIIQFSHVSFETISVVVEDVTEKLDLVLTPKVNKLNEVVVDNEIQGKGYQLKKQSEKVYTTSRGKIDPKKSGFSTTVVDGKGISNTYANIQEALVGKIPGYVYDRLGSRNSYLRGSGMSINNDYPVAWEIDGIFTTNAPILDLSQVKNVRALKSLGATNKYGTAGAGGVIIIETVAGNFDPKSVKKNSFLDEFANQNYYNNDAFIGSLGEESYLAKELEKFDNKQKAFIYYDTTLRNSSNNYGDHIDVAKKFFTHFKDRNLGVEVLRKLAKKHEKNPEILKSIAYHFQALGEDRDVVELYQQVFRLRPQYAQSYRDLANSYIEYDEYKRGWRMYMTYLMKGITTSEEGIGELIYNEMEWLYFQRSNQTAIEEKFVPIRKNLKEFNNDVRVVFEWNTSEAEFELEFVNPELRAYVFDHSLSGNNDLIIDEKKKGYSSKMFFVEDLEEGEWLVNLTYKGNKKPQPTYLKMTTFYNWGKPNEQKEIQVYKLEVEHQKVQLLQLNKQVLALKN